MAEGEVAVDKQRIIEGSGRRVGARDRRVVDADPSRAKGGVAAREDCTSVEDRASGVGIVTRKGQDAGGRLRRDGRAGQVCSDDARLQVKGVGGVDGERTGSRDCTAGDLQRADGVRVGTKAKGAARDRDRTAQLIIGGIGQGAGCDRRGSSVREDAVGIECDRAGARLSESA